jgi:hypothetical protein
VRSFSPIEMNKIGQLITRFDEFLTDNAHQISTLESALRSLTYVLPGELNFCINFCRSF